MSTGFSVLVELAFAPSQAEFAAELGRGAEQRASEEPETLLYAWYLDPALGLAHILKRYPHFEAFLAHMKAHVPHQNTFADVFKTTRVRLYGDVPEPLGERFADGGVPCAVFPALSDANRVVAK